MFSWKYSSNDNLDTRSIMIPAHSTPILDGEILIQLDRSKYIRLKDAANTILPSCARFVEERLLHDTGNPPLKFI